MIFFQSYDRMDADAMKQNFVLVIKIEEMLERVKCITLDSASIMVSTFKTNHVSGLEVL